MFENNNYSNLLSKVGLEGSGRRNDFIKVLVAVGFCWLPIAIISIMQNNFWTGDIKTSFITDFDVQLRLLVSMPILIFSQRLIRNQLKLTLNQFINAGIVGKEIKDSFELILASRTRFLNSKWTDFVVFLICYIQIIFVLYYESISSSVLSWQIIENGGETTLNFAGKWYTLVAGPFVLFLFYRWFLLIFVWGNILYQISKLKINLFPFHPDLCGGLGFLGYSLRYFSAIAFAMSAMVAGNMADYMIIENFHLDDFKLLAFAYFLFVLLLFTLPLIFFTFKLIAAGEKCVYENYHFANGVYRELRIKMSKKFDQVTDEDLNIPDFSTVADMNGVIDNALKMKFLPFTIKNMIPLLIMTAIPLIGVILIEIPVKEILIRLFTLMS